MELVTYILIILFGRLPYRRCASCVLGSDFRDQSDAYQSDYDPARGKDIEPLRDPAKQEDERNIDKTCHGVYGRCCSSAHTRGESAMELTCHGDERCVGGDHQYEECDDDASNIPIESEHSGRQ